MEELAADCGLLKLPAQEKEAGDGVGDGMKEQDCATHIVPIR